MLAMVPSYMLLGYSDAPPQVAIALIGVAYAMVPSALWPSLSYIVKDSHFGTAYGLMSSFNNSVLLLVNLLVGCILVFILL